MLPPTLFSCFTTDLNPGLKINQIITLFDENLACEFKHLVAVKLKNVTTKQKKTSLQFWCSFLQLFFAWLKNSMPCSSLFLARRNSSTPSQVAFTKMLRNDAKIFKKTDFLCGNGGHLLTSSGCFLTWASSLYMYFVQVIFAFVSFVCELSYLNFKLCSFAKV